MKASQRLRVGSIGLLAGVYSQFADVVINGVKDSAIFAYTSHFLQNNLNASSNVATFYGLFALISLPLITMTIALGSGEIYNHVKPYINHKFSQLRIRRSNEQPSAIFSYS